LGLTTYMTDPKSVLELLPEVRPNVFMSVPGYWEKIAMAAMSAPKDEQRDALMRVSGGRLGFCLSGGAGLKREIKEFFYANDILIIEGYGLTECSPTLTMNRPSSFDFSTVGKPLASVELRLADDGEILAKGPNVFSGYHKNPEATAEVFTDDGWFKTGDVGQLTDDGFLRIVDRKKDIIVTSGGKNIPPANIEVRFADESMIDHVVVYGDGQKYLVAGIWPCAEQRQNEDFDAQLEACVARVNEQLARVETIKKFFVADEPLTVENGLLTPSLKVKRKKVYQTYQERFEALYEG
ncbi:MAG: AMP-binding protein, partial [Myxococcota bacterium]